MKEKKSNATRFIEAYNTIDHAIRVQHNFKRSMSFSDIIRKAVPINYIVRRFEDDLIDYGRLRNAIIHRSNEDFIIAEPHDDVVENIEHISKVITTPPLAVDAVGERNVLCVQHDVCMRDVVELMYSSKFSNIPVYKEGGLIGVANGQRLLDTIGKAISEKQDIDDFMFHNKIEDVLNIKTTAKYYEVVDKDCTIEKILNLFYSNRKLIAVLVTKQGTLNEAPIGIITSSDIIEMNTILDNY